LKLEMTFRSYDSPFELLETEPPATVAPSSVLPAQTIPPVSGSVAPSPFDVVPALPDSAFGSLAGRPSALVPQAQQLVTQPSAAPPPPGPVNHLLFVLAAGVLPAVIVGGGAFVLRRRVAASLDID